MSQDYYEGYINGKPLNPNRGLPSMTYAQAEACGLTDSERLWVRTDGTGENIPIVDNLTTESATSALSAKQGKELNDKLNDIFKITITDLDALLNNGTDHILINEYNYNATGSPAGEMGIVMTFGNGNYRFQYAFGFSGLIYSRYYNAGTITNWKTIAS